MIKYLENIYDLKLEGDYYANYFEIDFDHLIELIGNGFKTVNKLFINLDLSLLFRKYNELYKIQSKDGDCEKITKEIMDMLPEIRDNFFLLLKQ